MRREDTRKTLVERAILNSLPGRSTDIAPKVFRTEGQVRKVLNRLLREGKIYLSKIERTESGRNVNVYSAGQPPPYYQKPKPPKTMTAYERVVKSRKAMYKDPERYAVWLSKMRTKRVIKRDKLTKAFFGEHSSDKEEAVHKDLYTYSTIKGEDHVSA